MYIGKETSASRNAARFLLGRNVENAVVSNKYYPTQILYATILF